MINEQAFVGFDNTIEWVLIDPSDTSDPNNPLGKPYDFVSNGVTKMELCVDGQKFSSPTDISYFDGGKVVIRVGDNDVIRENIEHSATLISFDANHPNGEVIVNNNLPQSKATIKFNKPC